MADYILQAMKTAYHEAPALNDCATSWAEGQARKGTLEKARYIGLLLFSYSDIQTKIGASRLPRARITLKRNTDYGGDNVSVTLAPTRLDAIPSDPMTRESALALAQRGAGKKITLNGTAENVFDLPGYTLEGLKNGTINGFMLIPEGESDTRFVRIADGAKLTLTVDAAFYAPTWTREIGQGDIISDARHSHIADLKELLYLINVRRLSDSLTAASFGTLENGLYKDWAGVIGVLQTAVNEFLTKEGKSTITFTTPGAWPSAQCVNEIRNAMQKTDKRFIYYASAARYAEVVKGTSENNAIAWKTGGPRVGSYYKLVEIGDSPDDGSFIYGKQYMQCYGFWVLEKAGQIAADLSGKTIKSAYFTLGRGAEGADETEVILSCHAKETAPDSMSVNDVFNTNAGTVTKNTGKNSAADISLSETMTAGILAGTVKGFGVRQGAYSVFDAGAALIIETT